MIDNDDGSDVLDSVQLSSRRGAEWRGPPASPGQPVARAPRGGRRLELACQELARDMAASSSRRSAEIIAREMPW